VVAAAQVVIDDDIARLGFFWFFSSPENPDRNLVPPLHSRRWSAGIIILFCKAFPALSLVVVP
jgi:hypothetical protein